MTPSQAEPNCVFVYGTLKRGFRFHHYLANNAFLGEAQSCEHYALYLGTDPWPLLAKQAQYPICGELFAVNAADLKRLDQLEQCPDLYTREIISVRSADGSIKQAWTYFAVHIQGEMLPEGVFALA